MRPSISRAIIIRVMWGSFSRNIITRVTWGSFSRNIIIRVTWGSFSRDIISTTWVGQGGGLYLRQFKGTSTMEEREAVNDNLQKEVVANDNSLPKEEEAVNDK